MKVKMNKQELANIMKRITEANCCICNYNKVGVIVLENDCARYYICEDCFVNEEETTIPFMIPKCRKCNVEIGLEDNFIEKEHNKLFHICKDCFCKEDKNEIFESNKFKVKWSSCNGCGETMIHKFMVEDIHTLRWYCKECYMNNDIKIVKGEE